MTNCKCGCEVRWCDHIRMTPRGWILRIDHGGGSYRASDVPDDYNYCNYCGTPRPAECKKKSLAEKLKGNFPYAGDRIMSDANWESTAKVAVEHFCELVDEVKYDWFATFDGYMSLLKKKFREQVEES